MNSTAAFPPRSPLPLSEDPPTVRVPIRCAPATPSALAMTPLPISHRHTRIAASDAGTDDTDTECPRVGETILGFELIEQLGEGAFAKVFLARQQALAGRPVALKITRKRTQEAERLARLQHTNIVPVYSVHDSAPTQLICMPFLGRRTIADLVRAYRVDHPSRVTPSRRTNGTRGTRAARTTTIPNSGSNPKNKPNSGAYPRPVPTVGDLPQLIGDPTAVLTIVAQLAAGLTHAHERGILHLDLKPANVLLADTGEPMLLDFNLSYDTTATERDLVGGTVPYMAPEQLLDVRSRGRGSVDVRTDLYSLGIMMFEMLTGEVPFPAAFLADIDGLLASRRLGAPRVRSLNPDISPAVEAIVRKLLEPEAKDRYQTAEELRSDIDRHLKNLPLLIAREASVRERFAKWRRRNPGVPRRLGVAALLGLVLGLGGVAYTRAEANTKAQAAARVRFTRSALDPVRLDLVVPGDAAARSRGISRGGELLDGYGLPENLDWAKSAEVRSLPESERATLSGDLGELLLLLARAKWEEAGKRPADEWKSIASDLLKLTTAARTCFPAGEAPPVLTALASELSKAAGEPTDLTPREAELPLNARDQFLEAAFALANGRYAGAAPLLEKVIEARPSHAAAQFALAYCRQQTGQSARALERYDAARVLLPTDPRAFYQRGLIYGTRNKPELAEPEFTRALELDPKHGDAYRYRGLARFRQQKYQDAEADFTAALEHGSTAIQVHLLRAEAREALKDAPGAAADRRAAAELTPKTEGDYLVRGVMRVNTDPKAALADFREAARINPRSMYAHQNQAHVFAEKLKDQNAALGAATRAVELYPEFAPTRAGYAVVLARLGKRDEAHREIEKARLISDDPEVTYQAGCVYALTSATHKDDKAKALNLLRQAFRDGYHDLKMIRTDHDLDPLRNDPDFRALEQASWVLFK